ncbi:AAA domain-containing protein [Deinococcus detaillensis]|nr:AAA domain-containing protein [Deinococcus detaillensis]
MTDATLAQDRSLRLFKFLEEFTQLKSKPRRTSEQDEVQWLYDLPQQPEIFNAARADEQNSVGEVWVEIKKPRFVGAPLLPEGLVLWVRGVLDDSRLAPTILDQRVVESEVLDDDLLPKLIKDTLFLDQQPDVLKTWEAYLKTWLAWATEDHRVKTVQAAYSKLFAVHQKLVTSGETFELVLGLGYLMWRTPGGYEVKRHLMTARASLTFDALQGVIRITAGGDGARTVLEQDMLDPDHRPATSVRTHIADELAENGEAVWDHQTLPALLKTWANASGERGEFMPALEPSRNSSTAPTIHWAPALVLRKRIERSITAAYQSIVSQLKDHPEFSEGFERFTTESNAPVISITESEFGIRGGANEIYFPLPANTEQRRIIQHLRVQPGVLVQGPPGTGKSHTIVNLVSHLLATEKRVLVTSHTARALKVLREKFPAELAALCVTHLRGEEGSRATLERSVQELLQRSAYRNPDAEVKQLAALKGGLEQARQKEDALLGKLREIRLAETEDLNLFGYTGKAQRIAEQLQSEEDSYSWLEDLGNPGRDAPLSGEEAGRLLGLLRSMSETEMDELSMTVPPLESLVLPEEFARVVYAERGATQKFGEMQEARQYPHYNAVRDVSPETRAGLVAALRALTGGVETARRRPVSWAQQAVEATLKGQAGVWDSLLTFSQQQLTDLTARATWLEETTLGGVGDHDPATLKADAQALLEHLRGGGSWGWGPMRPAAVRQRLYLKDTARVRGRAADTPEALQELLDFLDLTARARQLESNWAAVGFMPVGTLPLRLTQLQEQQDALAQVLKLKDALKEAQRAVGGVVGLPEPQWWRPEEVTAVIAAALAVDAELTREASAQVIEMMRPVLDALAAQPRAHDSVRLLQSAVAGRDLESYGLMYLRVQDFYQRQARLQDRQRLLAQLSATAPKLAGELVRTAAGPAWDGQLAQLVPAWHWLRADDRLTELANPDTEVEMREQLAECRREIRDTLGNLASSLAWSSTLNRLTQREQMGLTLWESAMKKLGKGTGKHAERHRRDARAALEQARSAIPAWIMPLHLVAESFTMTRGMFDVVIVDEASQAGLEAMFLAYIGKQIIIVGDDKQIEPDAVMIERSKVDALVEHFLHDFPTKNMIGAADASLFGIGEIAYPPKLSLREHFRCMPEIIAFSSRLSYQFQPLIALRQFGADRLSPVLARHVADGFTDGRTGDKVNEPEARAIVDQIKACIADPRYKDKTFGVISLLGSRQADRIATLLRSELPETEIERRRLDSGDAYSFQGDERDVMFLSMVTSPTEGKLEILKTDAKFQARLNVAASRARDQMWLFHSVELSDLKPDDLRAQLISHCQNPDLGVSKPLDPAHIQRLTEEAKRPNRGSYKPPKPFDSWFELDVYLDIAGRGYRVLPQYEVNGYHIDLVVEGMKGKLAVECDGDYWHGPDAYDADLQRQQTLERAGWTFWRVRGSTYFRDRHSALEDLWQTLERQRVFPDGDERNREAVAEVEPAPLPDEQGAVSALKVLTTSATPDLESVPVEPEPEGTAQPPVYLTYTLRADRGLLAPYREWPMRTLPDPRLATHEEVLHGLKEIVAAEGPMPCHRAYKLYARAAGLSRVGKDIQSALNKVVAYGLRQQAFQQVDEWNRAGQIDKVIRVRDTPPVRLRERGPRDFDEVPPMELAALIQSLLDRGDHAPDEPLAPEPIFRTVLAAYEGQRLTPKVRQSLERADVLRETAPALF